MKKLIFFSFLFFTGVSLAQDKSEINNTKHEVKSIVVELFSFDWYKNQKQLWEKEIKANKNNLDAYFNAYMANRGMRNLSQDINTKNSYDSLGREIAKKCFENNKNSFEGNYLMYMANNYEDIDYLYKAHEIDPNDDRVYGSLMVEAEFNRNLKNRKKFANLIFDNNNFSAGLMNWTYNLMIGLDKNAILITHGDNDTYGAWLNQDVNDTRTDILVVNSSMLLKDEYRKRIFNELNIKFEATPKINSQDEMNAFIAKNISDLIDHSNRTVYVANCNNDYYFGNRKNEFYLVGLSYQHCKENMDNISVIRNNFENKFKLDYLETNFQSDLSKGNVKRSNSSYLASMIKLYNHYCLSGDLSKAQNLKKTILKIAEENDVLDQVKSQLTGKC